MNTRTAAIVVFATALVTAVCLASEGFKEDMPYKQLVRELRKKESSMRKSFGEAINMKSKRNENCDPYLQPCAAVAEECEISVCDGHPLKCYPDPQTGTCGKEYSSSFRR